MESDFRTQDTWRIFRIMAEFVESIEDLAASQRGGEDGRAPAAAEMEEMVMLDEGAPALTNGCLDCRRA